MTMVLSPNAETPIGQLRCESSSCAIGGLAQPIPLRVLQAIGLHMCRLNDITAALSGVRRARGDGHILAVELADRAERISASLDALGHVHDLAAGNNVRLAFLAELADCGVPDFTHFGWATEALPVWWREAQQLASQQTSG